jgi:hypothetical protein
LQQPIATTNRSLAQKTAEYGTITMSNEYTGATPSDRRALAPGDPVIAHILKTLQGLRYGVVSIVVQDGVVVQIERTEKHRLRRNESA